CQQVNPDVLQYILKTLVVRQGGKPDAEKLSVYRAEIDEYDDQLVELISKRMKVSRLIGQYKKENNIQVLQAARYNEIIEERVKQAASLGIMGDCMQKILEAIHEESVRLQIEIMSMDNSITLEE
ncbi:MAG: chorismate mutase, partial [Bacteroidales bacterium]|nr:chorismate mutase [Bacteroidales bacterium]